MFAGLSFSPGFCSSLCCGLSTGLPCADASVEEAINARLAAEARSINRRRETAPVSNPSNSSFMMVLLCASAFCFELTTDQRGLSVECTGGATGTAGSTGPGGNEQEESFPTSILFPCSPWSPWSVFPCARPQNDLNADQRPIERH